MTRVQSNRGMDWSLFSALIWSQGCWVSSKHQLPNKLTTLQTMFVYLFVCLFLNWFTFLLPFSFLILCSVCVCVCVCVRACVRVCVCVFCLILSGSRDSLLVRAPDSWSKGCEFESRQVRRGNFLLQIQLRALTLIRCPSHHRVTAVASKRPRPFCQKCRWRVTPEHTYTFDPTKSEWAVYAAA